MRDKRSQIGHVGDSSRKTQLVEDTTRGCPIASAALDELELVMASALEAEQLASVATTGRTRAGLRRAIPRLYTGRSTSRERWPSG
jgi:hypothetical protein